MKPTSVTRRSAATPSGPSAGWMKLTLLLAGIYNLLWGGWVVLWPHAAFSLIELDPPRYPEIWQCVGMVVGVYGIGYLLAARDPCRHWPIVLVGLLGKIFGPIGFLQAAVTGTLPWIAGLTILTNDFLWWVPFTMILWRAYYHHHHQQQQPGNAS